MTESLRGVPRGSKLVFGPWTQSVRVYIGTVLTRRAGVRRRVSGTIILALSAYYQSCLVSSIAVLERLVKQFCALDFAA